MEDEDVYVQEYKKWKIILNKLRNMKKAWYCINKFSLEFGPPIEYIKPLFLLIFTLPETSDKASTVFKWINRVTMLTFNFCNAHEDWLKTGDLIHYTISLLFFFLRIQ